MLRSLPKRTRDINESDGMWKTNKWKIEFQVGKMGGKWKWRSLKVKMRMNKVIYSVWGVGKR